ncbi:MAG: ornithine carbamoyltransferase [Spirochaetia bacterium]|nr:ornithine carbamoyltransferase [Spirochaetia bacterium]
MKRNLLTLFDLEKSTFHNILKLALEYKKKKSNDNFLKGKNIGLIFEKNSTRTRVSCEVAINQLGGNSIYLSSKDLQLNRGESIEDTARVLSRYLDAVIIRAKSHVTIEKFAASSDIPVINALSDKAHPLQILADFLTIQENGIDLNNCNLCFLGDGQNNVCRSLMAGYTYINGTMNIGTHINYFPDEEFLKQVKTAGGKINVFPEAVESVIGADVLYTDVWVSMGNEDETIQRKKDLKGFQINKEILSKTGKTPIVLHCLPAQKGEEITNEVFESLNSKIFDQAENRLYSMKAVLKYVFNG